MTIPIQDAIKAVKINLAWCDAIDPTRWDESECEIPYPDECRFAIAARAGYKASLEFMLWWCGMYVDHASIKSDHPLGLAVLPLIAHLDATRPNWRTNEPV